MGDEIEAVRDAVQDVSILTRWIVSLDRRDGKVWGLHGEMVSTEGVCVREAIVSRHTV